VLAEVVFEFLARYFLDQLADDIGARAVMPALARVEQQGTAERIVFAGLRLEIAQDRTRERIAEAGRVSENVPNGHRS
jgi:hypothetical protein